MKEYLKAIKASFVIFIVGTAPVLIPTIFELSELFKSKTYYIDLIRNFSVIIGGIFVIFLMKKEYKIDIKKYIYKPKVDILVILIFLSTFYEICHFYLNYRNDMEEHKYKVQEIIGVYSNAIGAPIAEELIYRFGILTILLVASKKSRIKKAISLLFASIVFTLIHFPDTKSRLIELIVWAMIVSLIFIVFENIIYCMVYHMMSNAVLFSIGLFCRPFKGMKMVFIISLILLMFFAVLLVMKIKKEHLIRRRKKHHEIPLYKTT